MHFSVVVFIFPLRTKLMCDQNFSTEVVILLSVYRHIVYVFIFVFLQASVTG